MTRVLDPTERIGTMYEIEVIAPRAEGDLALLTLDELSAAAKQAYGDTRDSLVNALVNYVRLGSVLIEARNRVPEGGWTRWCQDAGIGLSTSQHAMRVAHYAHLLPDEMFTRQGGQGNRQGDLIGTALAHLRGLPEIRSNRRVGAGPEVKAEAHRLASTGVSVPQIADVLGYHKGTVYEWLNPKSDAQRKRERYLRVRDRKRTEALAAKEAERQERDRLARSTGGELSKSYGLVRQALAALNKVATPGSSQAISHLHKAEEAIVAEMRKERAA